MRARRGHRGVSLEGAVAHSSAFREYLAPSLVVSAPQTGTLPTCEDGVTKTATCEDQCACGGGLTDPECEKGINAFCTCLDTAAGCQGTAILDNYARCHRDPSGETATILKCFGQRLVGDQIECNAAIQACGSSSPSSGCTADADCGRCERCERSTGECLTKLACN